MRRFIPTVFAIVLASLNACAISQPATQPAAQNLPHIRVDVKARQVRVDCQMLGVEAPLEFFCVLSGTNEHESVLRTSAKPSNIHLALLMLGMEPGEPVKYSEAAKKWMPPHGPPLSITIEFQKDGKLVRMPATRLMRSIRTKEPMPPHAFIFAGSQIGPDGAYAADITGYVVSIVNFDLSLIDVPQLASNANETLEWQVNKDVAPPAGAAVTMIIEPMAKQDDAPATQRSETPSPAADSPAEQQHLATLRERWNSAVAPHRNDLRDAAQAHYEIIMQLRREQQQLIDQADQIQRLIDELEKNYQEMTTPQPPPSRSTGRRGAMNANATGAVLIAFVLSVATALASYVAAGATLGLLIGSLAFAALITPPLVLAVPDRSQRALIAMGVVLGNLAVWLFCLPIFPVVLCAITLLAFVAALAGVAHASRASVLPTLLAFAWLSFPIWLRSEVAAHLVAANPIFAMNGVSKSFGIWTQQPVLYSVTSLGQDVPYELPASIWPCVLLHGAIGLFLLLPVRADVVQAGVDDEPSDPQTRSTPPPAPQEAHTR